MKKIVSILSMSLVLANTSLYASFPVKNTTPTLETSTVSEATASPLTTKETKEVKKSLKKASKKMAAPMNDSDKELLILVLLWLFLGGLAAHRWYAGKPTKWNILFILTGGGLGIWALIDLINILKGNF